MEKGESLQKLLHTFAALADLGQEIADTPDFRERMRTSLHLVQGSLGIMRGALAQYDDNTQSLRFVASQALGDERPADLQLSTSESARLRELGIRGLTREDDSAAFSNFIDEHENQFDTQRVELIVPLVVRDNLAGIILLGGKATGEPFSDEDREVVCAMARHIAVGIQEHRFFEELARSAEESRQHYEQMRAIYRDTVRAFAAAIDCKDKYTQGHSERVGKYSEIIAREMGWSVEEIEGIAVAGYLHDIGKLVVERDIINAPYRIDAKQSSELNRHPSAGYEILMPINHPYADIPLTARYHHERIDGRGYPEGLTGDQIPFVAKIVSLADSFDAMTTDRPYKKRRGIEEVVEDFRRNTGKQFAAEVVVSFCRALLKEVSGEAGPKRFTRLLGKGYLERPSVEPMLESLIADLEAGVFNAVAGNA